jgi:bifunctional DNase/RNase
MLSVEVVGIRIDDSGNSPVLILKELSTQGRVLEIWIGAVEAGAIAMAQQEVQAPRPLTHDLIVNILKTLNVNLVTVRINELSDGVYLAELVLSDGSRIECRPSDGVAIAIRTDAPILVAEEVFDKAGFVVDSGFEDEQIDEETEIEAFKDFLENLKPEDF